MCIDETELACERVCVEERAEGGAKGKGEVDEGVDLCVVNIHYLSFYIEDNSLR